MDTNPKPRMVKAHSRLVADEYIRLGWTLQKEFYADGSEEPYEYFFVWNHAEEPAHIDWASFPSKRLP